MEPPRSRMRGASAVHNDDLLRPCGLGDLAIDRSGQMQFRGSGSNRCLFDRRGEEGKMVSSKRCSGPFCAVSLQYRKALSQLLPEIYTKYHLSVNT